MSCTSTPTLDCPAAYLRHKGINSAGLPYELTIPPEEPVEAIFNDPLNRLNPYQFSAKLINPADGTDIGIYNLSSGEKIILSLALLLYYFQHRNLKKSIVTLDEVDAHLHPSLTKQFFDVIYNVLIKEYGVRVIMATHSPSTVALAPVENLFVIKKGDQTTVIEGVNKDQALSILTSGVPSLSINYENRRQVFVESKYDAEYYETVYRMIKSKLVDEISLNFISSGVSGRGNCQQVIEIVEKLNGFGNKSIYGIIDWDNKNKPINNVKVLGEDLRYSIESYIFDPVLMGYYLLREKLFTNEPLGLSVSCRFIDFINFTQAQIQSIVTNLLNIIKPHFKSSTETTIQHVSYMNGMIVEIPDWFLKNQGHELPTIYFNAFPALHMYKDENGLRKEIINNTIVDIPEFISMDFLFLLNDIQGIAKEFQTVETQVD
jgi:energy-coupling factor transporter ATP-binding protein EcfA2